MCQLGFRVGKNIADRAFLNQLTATNDRHFMTDAFHHIHFMGNQQNGQVKLTVNLFKQF
ncbi:Uncharacterised protein [Vibrio cholerae]|nr:Uncharacterised protein [Vibrio cholerae]